MDLITFLQMGAQILKKVHNNWWARKKVLALTPAEQVSWILSTQWQKVLLNHFNSTRHV